MKTYQHLNLEQKMVKIRKNMPSLLKKFHNEEADYDFATLDDIYQSMTPALNKYGVNFDIVGEKPTQYENEKPVYLTRDQDGFWRYESDLEVCWTNIDNPKEERHAVIHILGTHEIPDKARGTAMTYGLKYYFRNKFCMRQIDGVNDDPDGMEYAWDSNGGESKEHSPKPEKSGREESGKPSKKKTDRNEAKKSVESKETRLSGNRCSGMEESKKTEKSGKHLLAEKETKMAAGEQIDSRGEPKEPNGPKSPVSARQQEKKRQQKSVEASDSSMGKDKPEEFEQVEFFVEECAETQPARKEIPTGQQTSGQKSAAGKQPVNPKEEAIRHFNALREEAGRQMIHEKTVDRQTSGQKQMEKQQETVSDQPESAGDGFQAAGEENVPFEGGDFEEQLEQELEKETKNPDTSLEAAKNFICSFGLYMGKKLGDVFNSGIKGQEAVKWMAYRYQGPDQEMVKAAKLVAENPDAVLIPETEEQAA